MPGARTSRPHSMRSMLIYHYSQIVPTLFVLRAQCGRDVRAPSNTVCET